jgi:hypothetical protein
MALVEMPVVTTADMAAAARPDPVLTPHITPPLRTTSPDAAKLGAVRGDRVTLSPTAQDILRAAPADAEVDAAFLPTHAGPALSTRAASLLHSLPAATQQLDQIDRTGANTALAASHPSADFRLPTAVLDQVRHAYEAGAGGSPERSGGGAVYRL